MMTASLRSRRIVLQLAGAALLTGIAIASADSPGSPAVAAAEASPVGDWLAEDILGGGVVDSARATLEIAEGGSVTGHSGCNPFGGTATIEGERIAFGMLVSTQKACAEALMNQEQKLHDALARVTSFRLEAAGSKLVLLDAAGEPLVRLVRA